jgi:predicted HTH transcriptional regulator
MKTVAALANAEGGTLLFGIDNDGAVVGIDDTRKLLDRMTQLIRDWVRPHVDFDIELTEVDGKRVLLVRVAAGAEPPYGVGTTDRRIDYHVRRSGTSSTATPTEFATLCGRVSQLGCRPDPSSADGELSALQR